MPVLVEQFLRGEWVHLLELYEGEDKTESELMQSAENITREISTIVREDDCCIVGLYNDKKSSVFINLNNGPVRIDWFTL